MYESPYAKKYTHALGIAGLGLAFGAGLLLEYTCSERSHPPVDYQPGSILSEPQQYDLDWGLLPKLPRPKYRRPLRPEEREI